MSSVLDRIFGFHTTKGALETRIDDGSSARGKQMKDNNEAQRKEQDSDQDAGKDLTRPLTLKSTQKALDFSTDILSDARRSHARLRRSHHSSLAAHTDVQNALRRVFQLQSSAHESQDQFLQLLQRAKAEGHWDQCAAKLCDMSNRLQADFDALEAHMSRLQTSQGRLANLEYKTRDRERLLLEDLDCVLRKLGISDLFTETQHQEHEDIGAETQSTTSTTLDPLLEVYYDKVGDAGVLRERLTMLTIEHQELAASRNMLADQGNAQSQTDSQFEAAYQNERQRIGVQLETAQAEAERAQTACFEAGLGLVPEYCQPSDQGQILHGNGSDQMFECSEPAGELGEAKLLQGDRTDQKTLEIFDWALTLSRSPPEPPCVPTSEEIKALPNFRGDPLASYEPVVIPRRRSSITHLSSAVSDALDIQNPPIGQSVRRMSLRELAEEQWDLAEVLRQQDK